MDSTRTITEHLQTMSAMVHDLKAAGREISKELSIGALEECKAHHDSF